MNPKLKKTLLMTLTVVVGMVMGFGTANAAHPDIPLYTYEEIGMQFTPGFNPQNPGGLVGTLPNPNAAYNMMPVMVNGQGKGFPYSPKQTCGNCHNGTTQRWDSGTAITDASGSPIAQPLVSYQEMTTETFHAELGAQEWQDEPGGTTASSQPGKPWSQTNGMWGKW